MLLEVWRQNSLEKMGKHEWEQTAWIFESYSSAPEKGENHLR